MSFQMSENSTSKPEALIGTTVGDYKIVDIIGQGGMGVVYTAEHTQLHHQTACKVLRAEMASHPETVERFLQEAKLISRIRHVNLIDIFDIGELPDKRMYYVMEKLKGRTLTQAMHDKKLPFAQIVSITNQICAGMAAAHAEGLVHRDLKPDNLFLVEKSGEEAILKIMDFGVAKVMDLSQGDKKITRTGYLVGTPQYMSPEQINGVAVDKRSDIYALGVILYEMSTGTPPFRGDTLGQMLIAHLSQVLPTIDPKIRNEDVPAGIEWIIRKALAKDANERYASVEDMSADLSRLVAGEPTNASVWYKSYQPRELAAIQTMSGNTLNGLLAGQQPRPRGLWLAAALLPGAALVGTLGYLALRPAPKPVVQIVKQVAPPPKREEIDMLALRSYSLTVLQEGLKDGDVPPRLLAVDALAASRDTRHRTLLEQRLADPDITVQMHAATALGQLGVKGSIEPLLALLSDSPEPKVKLAAAEALLKLGEPSALKAIDKLTKNTADPRVQLLAALALEEASPTHAQHKLIKKKLAKSPDTDDLLLILTRRARYGDKEAQEQLNMQLADGSLPAGRQLQIAAELNKDRSEAAKALLSKVAQEKGPQQVMAAKLICTADDPAVLPTLRTAFSEAGRPPLERLHAAEGMGVCGTRKDAGMLAKSLKGDEKSPLLRQAEAGSILRLASGDPAVVAEQNLMWAQAALTDENWSVRESAVALLGDADPQRAVPLLGQAMKDQRTEVRQSAAQALGQTKSRVAMAVLGSAMADGDRAVRLNVLRSIGKVSAHLKSKGEQPMDETTKAAIQKSLVTTADTGDPGEQVMAAATLLRMGDESRKDKLKQGLAADDPEVKKLAIQEASADPELNKTGVTGLLADKNFSVRFGAAAELAEQGRKDGIEVLREGLGKGGLDGLKAYGLLKKLGETVAPPGDLVALLKSNDVGVRGTVVETAASLPVGDAASLLKVAAKDGSATVRQKVLAVIAGWSDADGTAQGLPIVRALAEDTDVGVRSRANQLVSRLAPKAAPEPEEAPVPPPTAAAPTQPTAPAPGVADMAVAADLTAARDLSPRVDLTVAPAPPDLMAPSAAQTGTATGVVTPPPATPEQPAAPTLSPEEEKAQVKKSLEASERLVSKGDYAKAIQLLEEVRRVAPTKNLSMLIGQAYELWSEQESGSKQKTLTKKAIEAYKQVKSKEAKEHILELQQRQE